MMSGSGSTMFAVCKSRAAAKSLSVRAREHFGAAMWSAVCDAPG
ncbi:MAG: hypothetical protein ACREKL_02680 [Chthoniobacterales bacterium]